MYMDNESPSPRDRISDESLQRILNHTRPRLSDLPEAEHTPPCRENTPTCTPPMTWGLRDYPPASVYAPLQEFRKLYDCDTALRNGTVFEELNLPFMGATVGKGGCKHD